MLRDGAVSSVGIVAIGVLTFSSRGLRRRLLGGDEESSCGGTGTAGAGDGDSAGARARCKRLGGAEVLGAVCVMGLVVTASLGAAGVLAWVA